MAPPARVPRWVSVAVLVALVMCLLYAVGAARPLPAPRLDGDRLGPDPGESVVAYVAAADASLHVAPAADQRWALVSPVGEWTTDEVWRRLAVEVGDRVRIGRLLMRIPIDRVQTPTVTVPPGQSAEGVAAANDLAADDVGDLVAPGSRGAAIGSVSAARFRARVPSVVGAVVRGTGDELRAIAGEAGVRAVQVLPDGGGTFAVAALLPEYTVRAEPGPDDGLVPQV